ncbi:MAG TPA: hypothetical protein VF543_08720 [Pyrinomonadaceae bacterium]|jgi:hypothetical protein
MPCCAGVEGGCATGACDGALFRSGKKETEEEKLCGSEAAFKSHASKEKRPKPAHANAPDDADHCASDKDKTVKGGAKATAASSSEASGEGRGGAVSARVISAPCAKDCCAAASPSAQSRRGRDSALASLSVKLQTVDFVSLSLYLLNLQPESSAHLRRLKARAPPSIPPFSLT